MVRLFFIVGQVCAERPEAVTGQQSSNNYRNIYCELGNIVRYFSRQYRKSFFYKDIFNIQFS